MRHAGSRQVATSAALAIMSALLWGTPTRPTRSVVDDHLAVVTLW